MLCNYSIGETVLSSWMQSVYPQAMQHDHLKTTTWCMTMPT